MDLQSWKRTGLKAACWGFGFGVGLAAAIAAISYFDSRPKPWDRSTLQTKHSEMDGSGYLSKSDNLENMTVHLAADVENTASEDLKIAKSFKVLQAASLNGALHASVLGVNEETSLPAHHIVRVDLYGQYVCFDTHDARHCFAESFGKDTHVLVLDSTGRRELKIDLPTPTQIEQTADSNSSSKLVSPLSGTTGDSSDSEPSVNRQTDIFDQVARKQRKQR